MCEQRTLNEWKELQKQVKNLDTWREKGAAISQGSETPLFEDYVTTLFTCLEQTHLLPISSSDYRALEKIEAYFSPIGGILGYHVQFLEKLAASPPKTPSQFEQPHFFDLRESSAENKKALELGLRMLPKLGEIYVLGGLASRLSLRDQKKRPLPAAALPFKGRSLLEGLVRDVIAKEALYAKLFGKQVVVPIALMAFDSENNYPHITQLVQQICEKYARPLESFQLFSQIGVPVMDCKGKWIKEASGRLALQPGGHGALWRCAHLEGVLAWFKSQGKKALVVRQVNNPLAGVDHGLVTFTGLGAFTQASFGFAACSRPVHAEEGMLVQKKQGEHTTISNIEYTEFQKEGLEDTAQEDGNSLYPANTNILYVTLEALEKSLQTTPLLPPILNLKQKKEGRLIGRLESMMQSLSDCFKIDKKPAVYITYNHRHHTLSSAKKAYQPGKSALGTPEKAYYDWCLACHELLMHCGFSLPSFPSFEAYLNQGPAWFFDYAPQLGPLFSIICQKLRGGEIASGASLLLEASEVEIETLMLRGALSIHADHAKSACILKNVTVSNKGLKSLEAAPWKHPFVYQEKVDIIVGEQAEFYAEDVHLEGSHTFHVPQGEKWILTSQGLEKIKQEKPSVWSYSLTEGEVALSKENVFSQAS